MGTSSTPDAMAKKLLLTAKAFADIDRTMVREAALLTKRVITSGSPARLRGVGKRGAKLSVGFNVVGLGGVPSALVFARGPWQLIENDTRAHEIPRARTRRGRKRVVVIDGNVYAHAEHPGTRGQHPWRKGVAKAQPQSARILHSRGEAVLRAVF